MVKVVFLICLGIAALSAICTMSWRNGGHEDGGLISVGSELMPIKIKPLSGYETDFELDSRMNYQRMYVLEEDEYMGEGGHDGDHGSGGLEHNSVHSYVLLGPSDTYNDAVMLYKRVLLGYGGFVECDNYEVLEDDRKFYIKFEINNSVSSVEAVEVSGYICNMFAGLSCSLFSSFR